jgi:acetyl esterase/lipase
MMKIPVFLFTLQAALLLSLQPACAQNLKFGDIEKLPKPQADARIAYGRDPLQFGDLRLPRGSGPHPVVIVIHGGCWFAQYDLSHLASFCDALTKSGVATWSLEYRRLGNEGGGWPGTFEDVARGADYMRELAKKYPLDLKRVIVIGHSAGGHLALWLAARKKLPQSSELYAADPLSLRGVISLAGVTDLRKFSAGCGGAIAKLLGGSPEEVNARYQQTSPVELLPLGVLQHLISGARDRTVPLDQATPYVTVAKQKGDEVKLTVLDNAAHFEMISPQTTEWAVIEGAVSAMLKVRKAAAK